MTDDSEVLKARLALAARGLYTFPAKLTVNPKTGKPWKKSHASKEFSASGLNWGMTIDADEIRRQCARWPDAGIGIPMGPNGLWCLEADTIAGHGVDGVGNLAPIIAECGELANTLRAMSPTGSPHYYLRQPQDGGPPIKTSVGEIAPGVDVVGAGGQMIAPPSRTHVGRYVWINDNPILDPSPRLIEIVTARGARRSSSSGGVEIEFPDGEPRAEVDVEKVKLALRLLPNLSLAEVGGDTDDPRYFSRRRWLAMLMASHYVFNGSEEGYATFETWSAKNTDKHDKKGQRAAAWKYYRDHGPVTDVTERTIFKFVNMALGPGWDDDYNAETDRRADAINAEAVANEEEYARTLAAELAAEGAVTQANTSAPATTTAAEASEAAKEEPKSKPKPASAPASEESRPRTRPSVSALSLAALPLTLAEAGGGERGVDEMPTDLGNARRFVRHHGKDVRYVPAWKSWLVWRDGHWRRDDDGAVVRLAKATVEKMFVAASAIAGEEARKAARGWALKSSSAASLAAIVTLAKTELRVVLPVSKLDADPFLLGVENGVVDLRTGKFRPAQRDDYVTKRARVAYDPAAKSPNWDAFLDRIFAGKKDVVAYVQRVIGYCLTGDVNEEVLLVFWGKGANGKSTFRQTIFDLFGDYAMAADASLLVAQKNSGGGGATPDVARLRGKRLVTINETAENDRLNEARLKYIVSHDTISARGLYENPFDFTPTHKAILTTNHKPVIRTGGEGTWRRLSLVPFTVTIPMAEREEDFREAKLMPELPGILNWAIAGLMSYHEEGLTPPPTVVDATEEYRKDMDVVGRWIEEKCVLDPAAKTATSQLYDNYKNWATSQTTDSRFVMAANRFGRDLAGREGIEPTKVDGMRGHAGIRFKSPEEHARPAATNGAGSFATAEARAEEGRQATPANSEEDDDEDRPF